MPVVIAGLIFAGVLAIWLPYMRSGGFQEEVTPPGVNTTPDDPEATDLQPAGTDSPTTNETSAADDDLKQATPVADDREVIEAQQEAQEETGLRAVVVDRATGEPLPFFVVSLFDPSQGRTGLRETSDARGELHWPSAQEAGKMRFLLSDDETLRRPRSAPFVSITYDPNGEAGSLNGQSGPFTLPAKTGPTCWIDCELPDGYLWSDFKAQLSSGRILAGNTQSKAGYPVPVRAPMPGLRHPKLPWVRFHIAPRFYDLGWVQLISSDGKWKGGAWLRQLQGQTPDPLSIQLQTTTNASGRFQCDTMEEQDWIVLQLEEVAPEEGPLSRRIYDSGADDDGAFRFEDIEPGEYVLRTNDKAWFDFETPVTIRPGENDLGSFPLRARRIAGPVNGKVTSTSGKFQGVCHISLSGEIDLDGAPYDQSLDWVPDENGEMHATFSFEDVTEGDWFLYVHCHDGFTWSHVAQTIQAPATDLVINLDDPTTTLDITIHDAETGLALDNAVRMNWSRHATSIRILGPPFILFDQQIPLQGIHYRSSYPGYQPFAGDQDTLVQHETEESTEAHRKFSIPLQPGWGCLLQVRDRTSGHPVSKVGVWIDDLYMGHTDERGEITLGLPAAPKNLRLEKDGWQWVSNRELKVKQGQAPLKPRYEFGLLAFFERL